MEFNVATLAPLAPMGLLILTAALLILYEVFAAQPDRAYCAHLTVVGLGIALAMTLARVGDKPTFVFGASAASAPLVIDAFARVSSMMLLAGGIVATLLSPTYAKNAGHDHGEYYALLLFSVVGMMVMVMSADLITFFLGLETMSIGVYALTGIRSREPRSAEAALKYFLIGAFATGFLLFGIALIYGATGSVAISELARAVSLPGGVDQQPLLALGLVMIMIGFAFKVAAVPFHMWAPDVYEGAPTPVAGFMAVGVKAAAFLSLLRIVVVGLGAGGEGQRFWLSLLSALAVLTILGGNLLALAQQSVKRMLAYSSVSHAGYAMIGVIAAARGDSAAGSAVLFYLTGYTFMTLGAFGVLTYLERADGAVEAERFGAYAGAGFRHPVAGLAMSFFMVALAGLPPTGGFLGKLYVFSSALAVGDLALVLVGIAGSVISVFYYLRVLVAFYMREVPEPGPTPVAHRSAHLTLALAFSALAVLALGVMPSSWLELTRSAIASLRG
jgi:NADH-quinone oxidoreductase subunit N